MKPKANVSVMDPLPGDLRELALFSIEDIRSRLDKLQDLLAETYKPEELENGE